MHHPARTRAPIAPSSSVPCTKYDEKKRGSARDTRSAMICQQRKQPRVATARSLLLSWPLQYHEYQTYHQQIDYGYIHTSYWSSSVKQSYDRNSSNVLFTTNFNFSINLQLPSESIQFKWSESTINKLIHPIIMTNLTVISLMIHGCVWKWGKTW